MEGHLRTAKKGERLKGTHFLESAEGETSHETEGGQASDGHSQTGQHMGRDKSGAAKKVNERDHSQTIEGREGDKSGAVKESEQASEVHLPTGGRDKSGHQKKESEI